MGEKHAHRASTARNRCSAEVLVDRSQTNVRKSREPIKQLDYFDSKGPLRQWLSLVSVTLFEPFKKQKNASVEIWQRKGQGNS